MKRVYLIRHGETFDNRNRIIQGQDNSDLTDEGKNSILDRAKKIKDVKFDKVFCSPLGRTINSLEIIKKEVNLPEQITYVKEIMELDFGVYTKRCIDDIKDIIADHKKNRLKPYPDGESGDMLIKRVLWFVDNYILSGKETNFLVITHFGVIETILRHYFKLTYDEVRANSNKIACICFDRKEVEYSWIK